MHTEHEHTQAHMYNYTHKTAITGEGRSRFTKLLATDTSIRNEEVCGVAQGAGTLYMEPWLKPPVHAAY